MRVQQFYVEFQFQNGTKSISKHWIVSVTVKIDRKPTSYQKLVSDGTNISERKFLEFPTKEHVAF